MVHPTFNSKHIKNQLDASCPRQAPGFVWGSKGTSHSMGSVCLGRIGRSIGQITALHKYCWFSKLHSFALFIGLLQTTPRFFVCSFCHPLNLIAEITFTSHRPASLPLASCNRNQDPVLANAGAQILAFKKN